MKKRLLIGVIAVILIAAVACAVWVTGREGSRGILYRVTGTEGTAYLLGSIHIGTSAMHPFGATLQEAMADSDFFVFETDTSSDASLSQLSARQVLPADTSLRDVLGDVLTDDIVAAYQTLGLSTTALDSRQPWAVINTLAVYSAAAEMGARDVRTAISLGVETTVRDYADKNGKPFQYLETIDEIADTMESFSGELNRYLLRDEIDVILKRKTAAGADTLEQWPDWWREGNADAFRDYYQLSFQTADETLYREYQDKLVTQRNVLMANRLDAMLSEGGTYFVTVGLLHLVSEDVSILSLLREKGYAVERVAE